MPKQSPEQYKLDFGTEKKPEDTAEGEPALEGLGYDDLKKLYHEKVKINPERRDLNRGELISGIQDPEAEKTRIALEDMKEDQKERSSDRAGR
jgi:hypothetical protein